MGGHGVNLNQLHYHNLASFECVVLVGQVRPKFSCYINLSVYTCICISIFDPSSTYLFVYPQLRICLYKGIAKENLRGGVESPKYENQEGVQGVNGLERGLGNNLRNFFDFNVILFVFTSIFFNICNSKSFFYHFSLIFLSFSSVLGLYRPPLLGVICQGGGGNPTCAATLLCLYIFRFIYSSVHLSTVHIILILYLSLPIFPSFYLFVICLSTHFYFVSLDLECKISLRVLSGWGRGGTIPTQVSRGGRVERADGSFKNKEKIR